MPPEVGAVTTGGPPHDPVDLTVRPLSYKRRQAEYGHPGLGLSETVPEQSSARSNRELCTTRGSVPSTGSLRPHRPTRKVTTLRTVEQQRRRSVYMTMNITGDPLPTYPKT
jgi:hypothetical protein